jgi:hypothetical protein
MRWHGRAFGGPYGIVRIDRLPGLATAKSNIQAGKIPASGDTNSREGCNV